MSVGFKFGILLTFLQITLTRLLGVPTGSAVLCALLLPLGAIGAVLVWQRMRLTLTTVSFACITLLAGAGIALGVAGIDWTEVARAYPWRFIALAAIPLALGLLERWWNRKQWARWAAHMRRMTLRDLLRFRHIPDWRTSGST